MGDRNHRQPAGTSFSVVRNTHHRPYLDQPLSFLADNVLFAVFIFRVSPKPLYHPAHTFSKTGIMDDLPYDPAGTMEKNQTTMNPTTDRPLNIVRLVILFWLAGWLIKFPFFWQYLILDVPRYPIFNSFFPAFFQSPYISGIAYLLPIFISPILFSKRKHSYCLYAILLTLCPILLALHLNTCNDATFVSSAWTGLWLLAFTWHLDRMNADVDRHLKILGLSLIGLFFLGGTAGKLFYEFTSGQTIYGIFFESRPYWPHTWIRETFSIPQQHLIAEMVAKCILFFEGLLILSPFFPALVVLSILLLTLAVMVIFCSYNILSVNLCLLGVCIACVWIEHSILRTSSQPDKNSQT